MAERSVVSCLRCELQSSDFVVHKVHTIPYMPIPYSVCPLLRIGTPHPLSRKRVLPLPPEPKGGGETLAYSRWRGPSSDDWRKSLVLGLLCVVVNSDSRLRCEIARKVPRNQSLGCIEISLQIAQISTGNTPCLFGCFFVELPLE